MKLTTLCYIEKDDKYLMIHRIKKKHDINKDKWIGIGGKFERGESPEDCILRETKEETGLTLTSYRLRGVLTFVYNDDDDEMEYIFLYTADGFTGELADCNEGTLEWVPKTEINSLNLWEGDRIFHRLLDEEAPFFSLKLRYQNDLLKEAVLDGKPLELLDLLDENGEPSGEVRERTLVHLNGDWHRTSHVWVVRRRGDGGHDLLLQKRSREKDSFGGCYDISSAGHIPAGQDYLESALRELKEELGITAEPEDLRLVGVHDGRYEGEFHGRIFKNHEKSHVFAYEKPVEIEKLKLQKEEVESVKWMRIEDVLAAVKAMIRDTACSRTRSRCSVRFSRERGHGIISAHAVLCEKMRLLRLPFISDGPGDPEPVHEAAQGRY